MSSAAHKKWVGQSAKALTYLRAVHSVVREAGSGRRVAAQQITHAFAVLLMAQFQGFCRDLHTEATDALASVVRPAGLGTTLRAHLMAARALDRGNATAGNIGSDFDRLGIEF